MNEKFSSGSAVDLDTVIQYFAEVFIGLESVNNRGLGRFKM